MVAFDGLRQKPFELTRVSRTDKLVDTCLTFIVDGAAIIQRLMASLAIVKYFDILEDRGFRFIPGLERAVMDQFVFE